jgi:hypothetical protein
MKTLVKLIVLNSVFLVTSLIPLCTWSQGNSPDTESRPGFWQVLAPLDKGIASFSAYWSRINEDHSLKSIVIQSKLYLTYAEIDQFIAGDSEKAFIELGHSNDFAKQALSNAQIHFTDEVTKHHLSTILEAINQLRTTPGPEVRKIQYKDIARQMQHVIDIL